MAIYTTYDDILERFCFMTKQPTARHDIALNYCISNATPEIGERLKEEVTAFDNSVIENAIKAYKEKL